MKRAKKIINLFKLTKIQLIRRINTLEIQNAFLEKIIKDELYENFINKLKEPKELDMLKKENKNLKSKVKALKLLLKGDHDEK